MTPEGLNDQRKRAEAQAEKMLDAGRKQEAHRWTEVADRIDALLAEKLHVTGGAS